jgi:hypothetical protein
VRTADAKLIWKETQAGDINKEFYDLATDPGEASNLYSEVLPTAARLDSILTRWVSNGGLHPAPIPTAQESGRWRILKSLGYVN